MNYLWIVWDLVSIVSILILHYINFKKKDPKVVVDPPSRSNSTFIDVNTHRGKDDGTGSTVAAPETGTYDHSGNASVRSPSMRSPDFSRR
jgi:hypothetical protein